MYTVFQIEEIESSKSFVIQCFYFNCKCILIGTLDRSFLNFLSSFLKSKEILSILMESCYKLENNIMLNLAQKRFFEFSGLHLIYI